MPRRNVKKLNLADLLGEEGRANADLYKDDDEKRKNHVAYRVDRNKLISVKSEYTRRLSGDPARDIQYHELAREFINNGFKQTKAYAAVFGMTLKKASVPASRVFNSTWMRALIHDMLMGQDGEPNVEKSYLIEKLMKQIESNVLDYIDDDGAFLNVTELKALPKFCQQIIKKVEVHTWHTPNMINVGSEDEPNFEQHGEIRNQRVKLELWDKQKAMELLAKAMQWIQDKDGGGNTYLTANIMIAANKRVETLRKGEDIEGSYEKLAAD